MKTFQSPSSHQQIIRKRKICSTLGIAAFAALMLMLLAIINYIAFVR